MFQMRQNVNEGSPIARHLYSFQGAVAPPRKIIPNWDSVHTRTVVASLALGSQIVSFSKISPT